MYRNSTARSRSRGRRIVCELVGDAAHFGALLAGDSVILQLGEGLFAHTLPPHRPSPSPRRVGTCIMNFEACSAFTHVTACTLAESPLRPSSTGGFSSFVTSTAAPIATGRNEPVPGWDLHLLWTKRLSRRTRTISLVGQCQGSRLPSLVPGSLPHRRLSGQSDT